MVDVASRSPRLPGASGRSEVGQRQVGILLRNRPAHVAAFLGVLLGGGTVVVINPSRGDDRTRADIEALELPLVIGEPDDLASLVPARPHAGFDLRSRRATPGHRRRWRGRRPPWSRGADADQRNHGSAQANRPHLRHAGAQRDRAGTGPVAAPDRTASRGRDRQRPDGAHRWRLPRAAVRLRGKAVRVVGPIRAAASGPTRYAGIGRARCRWSPRRCGWCCTPI